MVALLNFFGLLLTAIGAFVTAGAVIISDQQAKLLSGTYWGGNEALLKAFLDQSHSARNGLVCILIGTLMQIIALGYGRRAQITGLLRVFGSNPIRHMVVRASVLAGRPQRRRGARPQRTRAS